MRSLEIVIKNEQKEEAQQQYSSFLNSNENGYFNSKSYRKGSNMFDSILSQIVVADKFGWEKNVDTYDYDFLTSKGKKIDLKTKPKSDSPPLPHWFASVPSYQKNQNCDYYIFNRINRNFTKLWLVGYIKKSDFWSKSTLFKEGDQDPDSSPRKVWKFPVDTNCIRISSLHSF